jgi:general stress protein 26
MSASGSGNDQHSAKSGASPSLTEKLTALRGFLGKHKTVMLTTHAPDGSLHSRCMVPAEITKDWRFRFIYDCESYKDTEIGKE